MSGDMEEAKVLKNIMKLADSLIHDLKKVYMHAATRNDYVELMKIDSSLERARQLRAVVVKLAMENHEEAVADENHADPPKLSLDFSEEARKEKVGEDLLSRLKLSATPYQIKKAKRLYDCAMNEIENGNLKAAGLDIKLAIQYDPSNREYREQLERIEKLRH